MDSIIYLLVFMAFSAASYQLFRLIFLRVKPVDRIKKYVDEGAGAAVSISKKDLREDKKFATKIIAKGIKKAGMFRGYVDRQKEMLFCARSGMKIEEYFTLKLVLVLFWLLLVFIIPDASMPVVLLLFAASFIIWNLPDIVVKILIGKRIDKMNAQLGDAIRIISNALKAGYGFNQALANMVKYMDGPIAEEFETVLNEIKLGDSVDNALERLSGRVGNAELGMVVTAVLIQRQSGGNLSEVLDNIADTIRGRVALKRELKSATAQGKISAIIISALPGILLLFCLFMNYKVYSMLFTTTTGLLLLVTCGFMQLVGIFLIAKIINIRT